MPPLSSSPTCGRTPYKLAKDGPLEVVGCIRRLWDPWVRTAKGHWGYSHHGHWGYTHHGHWGLTLTRAYRSALGFSTSLWSDGMGGIAFPRPNGIGALGFQCSGIPFLNSLGWQGFPLAQSGVSVSLAQVHQSSRVFNAPAFLPFLNS